MKEIEHSRSDYSRYSLLEEDVDRHPLEQFRRWMKEALDEGVNEPNAMVLSTVDSLGQPSSRVVLLRQLDEAGLVFYTNYSSRKAVEIDSNPQAALLFFWHEMQRQVRVEGMIEKLGEEQSDAYFAGRPRDSQIGAWSSLQSAVIPGRNALEANFDLFSSRFEGQEVRRPAFWGGYRLVPASIEFWQGRPSRLHDRLRYRFSENEWKVERLAP